MAKKCEICGRGATSGHRVSKSGIRTKRSWSPNLQRIKIKINNRIKKAYVCTSCIRSGKIEKVS
ncbi:MAG: 50S ribosomal protein L28 [Candidatus Aerophobetes bacterium]|nr:50S ribosomal protein L28 [Candidatus Aerophobetes bacterium]